MTKILCDNDYRFWNLLKNICIVLYFSCKMAEFKSMPRRWSKNNHHISLY